MSVLANNTPTVKIVEGSFTALDLATRYTVDSESVTVFNQVLQYFAEQRQRDLQSEEHTLTIRLNYVRGQLGKPKLSHLCSKCKGAV